MFAHKKAVSPIIAAVLLVVITIAIGATTMAFIRSLTDTNLETAQAQATRIACGADLEIDIPIVNNAYKICYNSSDGNIHALFHNTGTVNIKGFQITTIWTNGTVTTNSSTGSAINMNAYQQLTFQINGTTSSPDTEISQYIIEPKIQGAPGKGDTVCADVAIVRNINEIDACT